MSCLAAQLVEFLYRVVADEGCIIFDIFIRNTKGWEKLARHAIELRECCTSFDFLLHLLITEILWLAFEKCQLIQAFLSGQKFVQLCPHCLRDPRSDSAFQPLALCSYHLSNNRLHDAIARNNYP